MSSITKLAQCDRQLAVICHTPTSICNLMHRYDPYRYNPREYNTDDFIDGNYYKMEKWIRNPPTMHRFKNVEKLSISFSFFDRNASRFATLFSNLKHLSLFDLWETDSFQLANSQALALPSLESICFAHTYEIPAVTKNNSINQFFHLATRIVNNISSFKRLGSIHIHCLRDPQLLTSFLNVNNMNMLNQIRELCISVPMLGHQNSGSPLHSLSRFGTQLEKLCVVLYISSTDSKNMSTFGEIIGSILRRQIKLKVFQMVTVMDETEGFTDRTDAKFCSKRIVVLKGLLQKLVLSLNALQNSGTWSNLPVASRPLIFRFHIKSCHLNKQSTCYPNGVENRTDRETFASAIQTVLLTYLMTYPLGKIQVKLSWNTDRWDHHLLSHRSYLKSLSQMVRIDIKEGGTTHKDSNTHFYTDMDFHQYAISASNMKHSISKDDKDTKHHENKWKVDCRFCCNTPWI
eukprot:1048807_1